jgi:hypothetical protein
VQITTILCHWYFRWTILQTATSRPTFAKRKPPSPLRAVISSQGLLGVGLFIQFFGEIC